MAYNVGNLSLRQARAILGVHVGHKITAFNRCVGGKLSGSNPGNQKAVRSAFSAAARSCKK